MPVGTGVAGVLDLPDDPELTRETVEYVRVRVVQNIVLSALYFCLRKIFEVCLQRLQLFAGVLNSVECAPETGRLGDNHGDTGETMFTRDSVPRLTVKVSAVPEHACKASALPLYQQRREQLPSVQICYMDFPKDRGSSPELRGLSSGHPPV